MIRKKYLGYIPTGRAGSTSLRKAFLDCGLLGTDDVWDVPNKHGFFRTRVNRGGKDLFFPRWWELSENSNAVDMFTVVRNPYDRIVSGWLHSKREKWIPDWFSLRDYSVFLALFWEGSLACMGEHVRNEFLRLTELHLKPGENVEFRLGEILDAAYFHGMNCESSMHTFIDPNKLPKEMCDQIMAHFVNNGPPPSPAYLGSRPRSGLVVIQFEELQAGMDELCNAYGYPKLNIPVLNKSEHRHDYRHYHSDETVEFVKNYYNLELSAFDYTFDG